MHLEIPKPLRGKLSLSLGAIAAFVALSAVGSGVGDAAKALRPALGLAAVGGLAIAALKIAGAKKAESAPALAVRARAQLGPKNGIALVEADGRRYLLAFGEGFTELLEAPGVTRSSRRSSLHSRRTGEHP